MMAKRTAKDFSRAKVWEIATLYASTDYAYSAEYFSREYNISKNTFYTLLEKAVIESIVDERTVKKMAIKSAHNSETKAGKPGKKRSHKHYKYLVLKRKAYMLPKEKAIALTIKYANSAATKQKFLMNNFIDKKLFGRVILKCILANWVSDDVVDKLKNKSLRSNNSKEVLEFWEQLLYFRNENKRNQG